MGIAEVLSLAAGAEVNGLFSANVVHGCDTAEYVPDIVDIAVRSERLKHTPCHFPIFRLRYRTSDVEAVEVMPQPEARGTTSGISDLGKAQQHNRLCRTKFQSKVVSSDSLQCTIVISCLRNRIQTRLLAIPSCTRRDVAPMQTCWLHVADLRWHRWLRGCRLHGLTASSCYILVVGRSDESHASTAWSHRPIHT